MLSGLLALTIAVASDTPVAPTATVPTVPPLVSFEAEPPLVAAEGEPSFLLGPDEAPTQPGPSLQSHYLGNNSDEFPHMPLNRLLADSLKTVIQPAMPEGNDWLILGGMALGAGVAFTIDVTAHSIGQEIPDPHLGDHALSYWVSYLGEGWLQLGVFVAIGLVGGRSGQRVFYAGLEALAATALVSRLLKVMFREERPSVDPLNHHFFSRTIADSFPSGHTMVAFATAAVLASEWPWLAPVFYGLATWVGVARMQQRTHWLSDVVVGAGLGTLFGLGSWKLTRAFELDVQPWAGVNGAGISVSRQF